MRNRNIKSISIKPADAHASPVSPAVFYKLHEGTGTAFADALGNGPALTLAGSGTPLATAGWITPNGTDDLLQVASADMGVLTDIFRLDDDYHHIITAIDMTYDGAVTGQESLWFAGVSANNVGGWGLTIRNSTSLSFTRRALGASNHSDEIFTEHDISDYADSRMCVVLEVIKKSASLVDLNLFINGIIRQSLTDSDLLVLSGTAPYAGPNASNAQGFTIGATPNGSTSKTRLLNSAGSNAKAARFLAIKPNNYDTTLALRVAQEMYKFQGEAPRCLNGR